MCILGVALNVNKKFPFILIANRDESYERPTMHAHFWEDAPYILAGKDLENGGSWLGISRDGSIAALTNVREKQLERRSSLSRGELVKNYLQNDELFRESIRNKRNYDGFNLLFGNIKELTYISNQTTQTSILSKGIHVLSNGCLDSNWPKMNIIKKTFRRSHLRYFKRNTYKGSISSIK